MFTAIALIAFSGVSMANTIKEVEVQKNKNAKTVKKRATDCCIIYDLAFGLAMSEGAGASTAEAAAILAYNNCEKSNKTLNAGL